MRDVDLRELERAALSGDGEAALDLLRIRARRGELPNYDPIDVIVALREPSGRGAYENYDVTARNELEFVERVLSVAKRPPHHEAREGMIASDYGDEPFPPRFGENLAADVDWLGRTYRNLEYEAFESEVRAALRPLANDAQVLLTEAGIGERLARESLRHFLDYPGASAGPDLIAAVTNTSLHHDDRVRALAIAALRRHISDVEQMIRYLEDLH